MPTQVSVFGGTGMGDYSAIRRKEILLFPTTRTQLEGIKLSEVRQTERRKSFMTSLIMGSKIAVS